MDITSIVAIIILVTLSAIFSLIEASFFTFSDLKVDVFIKQKKYGSKAIKSLKDNPRKVITTLLFGNTLVNFSAVSIASAFLTVYYPRNGALIATLLMTAIILFYSQIVPKVIGEQYSYNVLPVVARPTQALITVLRPFTFVFDWLSRKLPQSGEQKTSAEEFEMFIKTGRQGGILSKKSEALIKNMLDFQNISAGEIIIPYPQVKYVEAKSNINDAVKKISDENYSRYPVIDKETQSVVGIISPMQLVNAQKKKQGRKKIKVIMEEPFIIPEIKNVQELMIDMNNNNQHMAIVVDEYGSFKGVITEEDITKQFLGKMSPAEVPIGIRTIYPGDTLVEAIQQKYETKPFTCKAKTIAGLLEEKFQRIPEKGEYKTINGLSFEVVEATKSKIKTIRIR